MIRKVRPTISRTAAALVVLLLAILIAPQLAAAAPPQQAKLQVELSKDAYWYQPDATANFRITIENLSKQVVNNAAVRAKVYPALQTRQAYDDYLDGKLSSYRFTQYVTRDTTLKPGKNAYPMEMNLSERGLPEGVYPVVVEVLRSKEQLAYAGTQLVVVSPGTKDIPLQIALVFDVMEPPRQGVDGNFTGSQLAAECTTTRNSSGWLAMVSTLDRYTHLHASIALSPLLLEQISQLSVGATIGGGAKPVKLTEKSPEAVSAASVLNNFRKLAGEPAFQYLQSPYASPDVENLWNLGWYDDARGQISRGDKALDDGLKKPVSDLYFYPPGQTVNSRMLRNLGGSVGQFMVLDSKVLDRSKDGRKLKAETISAPIEIRGASGRQTIALFGDSHIQRVLTRVSPSGDSHGVAQCIAGELANLYLENPQTKRTVTMVWPANWRPRRDVFEEIMKLLDGTPWLQTLNVGEAIYNGTPVNKTALAIPTAPTPVTEVEAGGEDYFTRVSHTRDSYLTFSDLVFRDNPLLPADLRSLYLVESDAWRQWGQENEGLLMSADLSSQTQGELSKIELPKSPTVTVTGSSAKIPVSITNSTGYRVKTTLDLSSNGLTFPDGAKRRLVLEPKENIIDVPVKVTKKGKVLFRAKLLAGRTVLSTLEIPVKTGRFSTFAILLVAVLLTVIIALWASRVLRRRKSARHSAPRKKGSPGDGEPGEA